MLMKLIRCLFTYDPLAVRELLLVRVLNARALFVLARVEQPFSRIKVEIQWLGMTGARTECLVAFFFRFIFLCAAIRRLDPYIGNYHDKYYLCHYS